jgi:hypothetical protein
VARPLRGKPSEAAPQIASQAITPIKVDIQPSPHPSSTMLSFPTPAATFDYLRSPAGGSLMIRESDQYALVYYKKGNTDPRASTFRSTVWDMQQNRPLYIAPARMLPLDALDPDATGFTTEEFMDGFMINMFWAGEANAWKLTTRTQLDASGHFYSKRSFAELFWEAFAGRGLTVEDLDKGMGYSWVVQHPEERVVVAPAYGIPTLTLVNVATLSPDAVLSDKLRALQPATYPLTTVAVVREFVFTEGRRLGHQFQGVVVTHAGQRYKMRSSQYEAARVLRGNQPKRPYAWLEHWGAGTLPAYLRLFPEEACEAEEMVGRFKECTQEAYDLYVKVYRERAFPLKEAPQKYRKLLWEARQDGTCAYFPNMRNFMNRQDTARKLWLVNYEVRYAGANAVDISSADVTESRYGGATELTGSADASGSAADVSGADVSGAYA